MLRRKTRTRRNELGAALAAALILSGCGGGDAKRAAPQPKLPTNVATDLAARSDAVAIALDAGDSCQALAEAERLRQDAIAAINAGGVPAVFQEQLQSAVNRLVARIDCVPPAAEDDGDRGKGKAKGKHKRGKGDD